MEALLISVWLFTLAFAMLILTILQGNLFGDSIPMTALAAILNVLISITCACALGLVTIAIATILSALSLSRSLEISARYTEEILTYDDDHSTEIRMNRMQPDISSSQKGGVMPEAQTSVESAVGVEGLYSPLVDTDIRLLRFTGNASDPSVLTLELIQASLLTVRRKYTALSYCWGGEPATRMVFVNGKRIGVRPDLEKALHRLRDLGHELIWVDALCINQADYKERGAQVLRMRTIYADARMVIAWMGQDGPAPVPQRLTASGSDDMPEVAALELSRIFSLGEMTQSPYWTRVWIVQEFATATNLELLFNNIDLVVDRRFRRELGDFAKRRDAPRTIKQVMSILQIRQSWQTSRESTLLELLIETSGSLCTNRLDRVFGVLALARDGGTFLSEPNYEASELDLSLAMTTACVEGQDKPLDIILLGPYFSRLQGLPSWCPNYFRFDEIDPETRSLGYVCTKYMEAVRYDVATSKIGIRQCYTANGSSKSLAIIEGPELRSLAQSLGPIGSLGWMPSDGDTHVFPCGVNCGGSTTQAIKAQWALWELFAITRFSFSSHKHRYPMLETVYRYFTLCVFYNGVDISDTESQQGRYAQWISANQQFTLGGKTLQQHAKEYKSVIWNPMFWLRQRISDVDADTGDTFLSLFSLSAHGLRDSTRLLRPLKHIAEQNMRLMSINMPHPETGEETVSLGLAHEDARLDDEVFLLPGCSMPVILRRLDADDHFKLVGEAIIPGVMKGERWTEYRDAALPEVRIV